MGGGRKGERVQEMGGGGVRVSVWDLGASGVACGRWDGQGWRVEEEVSG